MKRIVWTMLSGGVLLAGCQSSPLQTAKRDSLPSTRDGDKRMSLPGESENDGNGSLIASRMGAGPGLRTGRREERNEQDRRSEFERESDSLLRMGRTAADAAAHHKMAVRADKAGDFRRAAKHYQMALRFDGDNPDLLNNVGYSNLMQKRYRESEHYLQQAYRLAPNKENVNGNLGLLYVQTGDNERAFKHFLSVSRGDEGYARKMMASVLRDQPDLTETQLAGPARRLPDSGFGAPDPADTRRLSTGFGNRNVRDDATHISDATRALEERMRRAREESLANREREHTRRDFAGRGYSNRDERTPYRYTGYENNSHADQRDPRTGHDYREGGRNSNPNFPPRSIPDHRMNDAIRDIDRGYGRSASPIRQTGGSLPDWNNAQHDERQPSDPRNNQRDLHDRDAGRPSTGSGSQLWPPENQPGGAFSGSGRSAGSMNGRDDHRDSFRRQPNETEIRNNFDNRSAAMNSGTNNEDRDRREALRIAHNTGSRIPFPIPEQRDPEREMRTGTQSLGSQPSKHTYTRFDRTGNVTRSASFRNPDKYGSRSEFSDRSQIGTGTRRIGDREERGRRGYGNPNEDYPELTIQPRTKRGFSNDNRGAAGSGYSQP